MNGGIYRAFVYFLDKNNQLTSYSLRNTVATSDVPSEEPTETLFAALDTTLVGGSVAGQGDISRS